MAYEVFYVFYAFINKVRFVQKLQASLISWYNDIKPQNNSPHPTRK